MRRPQKIFFLLFFPLVVACAKDIITGKSTLNYYNLGDEPKFGEQVLSEQMRALKKGEKPVDSAKNAKELDRIRKIVQKISKVTHYPQFPYEVHLADVPVVNAWCAPGGKMMVYEGLWSTKDGLVQKGNENELAAVLGHEMAHANARHVTESLSRNMTIAIAGGAVQSAIGTGSAQGADLFGQVFGEGFNIFVPSYSRKNELEADRLGLLYMAKAGFDPRTAIELWKKAAKNPKNERTSIYASHPSSGERVKQLEKHLPEALDLYFAATGKKGDR